MIEWFLNFLACNGGLIRIFFKLAIFKGITYPERGSSSYYSIIGLSDPRLKLINAAEQSVDTKSKRFVDLCIMAAKLAYETEVVERDVLANQWNMSFQKFFECWDDRAERNTTEAFVFMDQPKDAELVFVAFRGTEPFDAYDWSTDFDFSWYELDPELGKIHVGFLEALGLVNRRDRQSFENFKWNVCKESTPWKPQQQDAKPTTGLTNPKVLAEKVLAFDSISQFVGDLLQKNPRAKLYLTGHSLGGALAILFAGILMFKKGREQREERILEKLAAIHTFGQPRVGDVNFAAFMDRNMEMLKVEYYRIVYCNDFVTRVPFDDGVFGFKHCGQRCYFFDSFYKELTLESEPNKNFFSPIFFMAMFPNAVWELVQGWLLVWLRFGNSFRESKFMMAARLLGLILPGIASHFPVNYVNSVRLGPYLLE